MISCKKDANNVTFKNSEIPTVPKVTYSYKDTITAGSINKTVNNLTEDATWNTSLSVVYKGNGNYQMTVNFDVPNSGYLCTYTLYKDGALYEAEGTYSNTTLTITRNLPIGNYYFTIGTPTLGTVNTPTLKIVAEPTAPAGMLCLYRYFNPTNGQHICTSDWEELGSSSLNFVFEKVLGYMSESGDVIGQTPVTLKPIYRFYNASSGSHFETDEYGNYPGYLYEKVLGYVGITATDNPGMTRSLTKWYSSTLDDHFVCVPPDVPIAQGYTKDIDFTFGYVQ